MPPLRETITFIPKCYSDGCVTIDPRSGSSIGGSSGATGSTTGAGYAGVSGALGAPVVLSSGAGTTQTVAQACKTALSAGEPFPYR